MNPSHTSSRFPLFRRLPKFDELTTELILDRFLEYLAEKNLELYPAQEEAILSLFNGQNVILNTPTGSGKSLVATALHFYSLSTARRSVYTCPIKALVNEKFLALCREFGPEQVGMVTGDGSVNRDAPILCCTAEILANMALREGELAAVDDVIMDEFHYYSDRDRGVAWQIPLLELTNTRFLLMSATLGEMDFFKEKLTDLNGKETAIVSGSERPVPLKFEYRETPIHETIGDLVKEASSPIYLVNFTQREAAEAAQSLMSVDFCSKEQKKEIADKIQGTDFSSPYGKEIQKFLKHGIGLHHAGLLPKYRVLVEKLAQAGLLKVISGTDTLGVGVNVPIRTVLFTKLCKYDGEKTTILSTRDFHQIAGRAGRKGFDTEGRVVVQAPAHVIENLRMEAKAKADPKKAKKIVKQKPPERGYVHWTEDTFRKLVDGKPEALQSRFGVSHGMLLNVLARENTDGCQAMRGLIRKSHEAEPAKKKYRKHAFTLFRSLLSRKIVELIPGSRRGEKRVRVQVDLQEDFSLNHALSLYLIDTISVLGRDSETYARDILTLVEAILENPDLILRRQLDRVKTEKMREMKEAGMEYEERMEELEKLEHPKPLRDFIYTTFNEFSEHHPWVGSENIRPKSVAREMYETYQSFAEYIREYELQRAEGVLLRYLSDVYKTLVQTVPEEARNEELESIIDYFGAIVRSVDASLVEEWERLKNPDAALKLISVPDSVEQASAKEAAENVLKSEKALRIRVTNEVFRLVRTLSIRDTEASVEVLSDWGDRSWTVDRLNQMMQAFYDSDHRGIRIDPASRKQEFLRIKKTESLWQVEQTLVDTDENNDWHLVIELDLKESQDLGKPALRLIEIAEIGR